MCLLQQHDPMNTPLIPPPIFPTWLNLLCNEIISYSPTFSKINESQSALISVTLITAHNMTLSKLFHESFMLLLTSQQKLQDGRGLDTAT